MSITRKLFSLSPSLSLSIKKDRRERELELKKIILQGLYSKPNNYSLLMSKNKTKIHTDRQTEKGRGREYKRDWDGVGEHVCVWVWACACAKSHLLKAYVDLPGISLIHILAWQVIDISQMSRVAVVAFLTTNTTWHQANTLPSLPYCWTKDRTNSSQQFQYTAFFQKAYQCWWSLLCHFSQ